MKLVIAEKPSVAQSLAKVLGIVSRMFRKISFDRSVTGS